MKKCNLCLAEKSFEEFYFRKDRGNYRAECKECMLQKMHQKYLDDPGKHRKIARNSYARNRDKRFKNAYEWRKRNPERVRKIARDYYHRNKEKRAAYSARYEKENRDKKRAHRLVKYAKKSGEIVPEPCVYCGDKNSQAHHDDYSKPYDVIWLCPAHHSKRHKELA